ncbi:MAG: hypothetical protein WBL88_02225, partial [Nitrososphaeraceae archaeon]
MNKKQTFSAILAGIAISAILVTSSLITGSQISHQALAQQGGTTSPPTTAPPITTPPTTSTSTSKSTSGEPGLGKTVTLQGTVSSATSPLAGRARDQVAVILPPRKDGGVYTGVITFTGSKGVQPEVWNQVNVNASTPIPRAFGSLVISPSPTGKGAIATALVGSPSTSNSVPFTGNALALHSSRAPFLATYTVTASVAPTKSMNNLSSTTALAAGTLGGATTGGSTGGGATPSGTTLGGTPSGTTLG